MRVTETIAPSAQPIAAAQAAVVEERIVKRIIAAVMENRLPAGTKLSESALCETFGVSRARVRRALLMLAGREIVVLHSNRGAFISQPSADEARDVFEARRTIEPVVVRKAIQNLTDANVATLFNHVKQEAAARAKGDRHQAIRLSGQFHVQLAGFANNPVLTRFVGELVARTSLIIGLFGRPGSPSCSEDEHFFLTNAISDRLEHRASDLMVQHLRHIEGELELRERGAAVDLREVLKL
jgi:DNA-binding GntR family transcriptional regulator